MGSIKPKGSPAWSGRLLTATLQDTIDMLGDASVASVQDPRAGHNAAVLSYLRQSPHRGLLAGVYDANKDNLERLLRASYQVTNSIIREMQSTDPSAVSALILDRALGEAIMRVCYLLDASVPPAKTLVRMATYHLETIEGNLRTAEAFGDDGKAEAAAAREQVEEFHGLLKAGGFEIGEGRRAPFSGWVRLDGQTESASFNATDAYKKYIKVGSWQWAIGSGATHGLGWLLPNVIGTVDEAPMSTAAETLLTVLMSSIELTDALARAAHGYTGVDVDPFLKRVHQRRLGASAALGMPLRTAVNHREYGRPDFKQPTATTGAIFRGD